MAQKKDTTAPISEKMLLTAKEMSKVSGIGENTLRHLMDIGELEYIQVGSHRRIRREAIWDYYNRHKTSTVTPFERFNGLKVPPCSMLRQVSINIL